MSSNRQWTIYLAQDKHLDYNWCGTQTETEIRMVSLMDYYLEQAEQAGAVWNLDGTIWLEVYRRHRGEEGAQRLLAAIQNGKIGYAANYSVLLWGLMSTELAIRACYGSLEIERVTHTPNKTVLIMENPGLLWGVASVLTESGFPYLSRGIYNLRAESYMGQREPYPLFWWKAPSGKRVLVRWDLYDNTRSWGGYAEAGELARLAGEGWDAFHVQTLGDRNTPDVYEKRKAFIQKTIERYEAYGKAYPISSILLLGTGHDNWTKTDDYRAFIQKFNAEPATGFRIVDARYEDFFEAAYEEIKSKDLDIPVLEGSFGICWEEWGAHLGGLTRDFREGERLLRLAEAKYALEVTEGKTNERTAELIRQGYHALLNFAEHDMGGINRRLAAISAGARASAATQVLDIARSLYTRPGDLPPPDTFENEATEFSWYKYRVKFDEKRCAVISIEAEKGEELISDGGGPSFGEFVHTRYQEDTWRKVVFPDALEPSPVEHAARLLVGHAASLSKAMTRRFSCLRGSRGVEIRTEGERWGFQFASHWLFHADQPWIDVTYYLADGWSDQAQSVQFCFPIALDDPIYRYDTAGAVLIAGPESEGGHDLPGSNPKLFAAQTFASASGRNGGLIMLTPDAYLVQFGPGAVCAPGYRTENIQAQVTSMPLMNLTRGDDQLGQGGQREWKFRYRLIFTQGGFDCLKAFREAQRFCVSPFLQVPGVKPMLSGIETLEISFAGGPVTAFKVAEDGRRLILRFWNVLDRPADGSVELPAGFVRAELCDALERRKETLPVEQGRVRFTVSPYGIFTIAFCPKLEGR